MNIADEGLRQALNKEIPILRAQIQVLFKELDHRTGLNGASVPVVFGYETDVLGSYTRAGHGEKEHFFFSLLFIGYAVARPLSKADRVDLFKHEYAHYMQYNMKIPAKYQFQPGIHGSAWKYCCSIVGAAPTPYYKAGEALMKHDYKKVLHNPIHDKMVPVKDQYRRERAYQNQQNSIVRFKVGDVVQHPKFGQGTICSVEQQSGAVHLEIQFSDACRTIDQKWLLQAQRRN